MWSGIRKPGVTVVKVGGSLLEGPADLRRAAAAIAGRRGRGPLLVVASAVKGVTDLLVLAAGQARDGRLEELRQTLRLVRLRHVGMTAGILDGATLERLEGTLDELDAAAAGIGGSAGLTDHAHARLLSFGERLSVLLVAAAVREAGADAVAVDSEETGLRAEGPPLSASCDLAASAAGFERLRRGLEDRIPVLTGFYAVDREGAVVLFGRGGSDNTACAVAAGLGAERLELWKDVPGFMSADPREVRSARVLDRISFGEVAQMAAFGSRVVNYGCLEPLHGRATRIVISSIPEDGADPGTALVEGLKRDSTRVIALASRRNNGSPALVGAVGDGVAHDAGIRSRLLACLAEAGVRGDRTALPSGNSGLSCSVHPDDLPAALSGLHREFLES